MSHLSWMKQLTQQPVLPFNIKDMLSEPRGLSLFRYSVRIHRGTQGEKRKKKGRRDGQKRTDERRVTERQREICFLFTERGENKKQSSRLLDCNTHTTHTHYLPLSVSWVITQNRFSPKLHRLSLYSGDIWRLVICSQFRISLMSLLWPVTVLTGSSLQ